MTQEHHLTFGPFRLETTQARLWRGEQAIPLRPRTSAVLQYLATHTGRVVTKTELLQHVWAGTHVTETVLRVCIREIRVALADVAEAPQYLQTVGRQGYQWLVAGDGAAGPRAAARPIGDELWHRFFEKAPDEMTLSAEAKRELDHALRFQRSPYIRRRVRADRPYGS
jgi:hypothetical protein